jgi:hypothetical protein
MCKKVEGAVTGSKKSVELQSHKKAGIISRLSIIIKQ